MKYLALLSAVACVTASTASFAQSSTYYNVHNHYDNDAGNYKAVATPGNYDYQIAQPTRHGRGVVANDPVAAVQAQPWYFNHAKGSMSAD